MKAELIDSLGTDLTVVNAARVSFDKESEWEWEIDEHSDYGDFVLSERDKRLIHYLATHEHTTPFTHPQITLRETVPIFVARQRFKHVVGFTYNEVSRRYVDSPPKFYVPQVWRKRADNAKQGSSNHPVDEPLRKRMHDYDSRTTSQAYERFVELAQDFYEELLENGTCPEQARMVLPQSMMTSYYVTGSLAAFARAYNLRSDSHSQLEIQMLAKQWGEIIKPLFPCSWKALTCM